MMAALGRLVRALRDLSIGVKLALLIGIALFPLGLISVYQTRAVVEERDTLYQRGLIQRTERAADADRALVVQGIGLANALAIVVAPVLEDAAACSEMLSDFVRKNEVVVFAGFISTTERLTCGSTGVGQDLHGNDLLRDVLAFPATTIRVRERGAVSGLPIVAVAVPVTVDGRLEGTLVVSIPRALFTAPQDDMMADSVIAVVDSAGRPLDRPSGRMEWFPPPEILNRTLAAAHSATTAIAANGAERRIAVVPIVSNQLFAIGSYPASAMREGELRSWLGTVVFPLAMFLVSLAVAYTAVHGLVVKHLLRLGEAVSAFAAARSVPDLRQFDDAAPELRHVAVNLHRMTKTLLDNETALTLGLKEKTALLREVHHRVKNNLQLVVSIMNMQIRESEAAETRASLEELQDRVIGISSVYSALYAGDEVSEVRIDRVIEDVIQRLHLADHPQLAVTLRLDPVSLVPDQAVALVLLVAEALGDAARHHVRSRMVTLDLELRQDGPRGAVTLTLIAPRAGIVQERRGTGTIAAHLMRSFALQLGSELVEEGDDTRRVLSVRFLPQRPALTAGTRTPAAALT